MELCANNATNLLPYIGKLLEDGKEERFVKQALDTCLEIYTDATHCAEDAITAFKNKDKDYFDAIGQITTADDYSAACEDSFNERNLTFPLRKQVDYFSQLADISLVIIDLVEK
ncbi:uncharacterized protein LOC113343329 [Papaver somniferum]|uniref:uncharacterized protein LOC113343329 n=1 Tax=Papaver somniferum TaxID=3469 RepID=UPI000E7021A8|nr:uncharacterized protein LOC113343329 [Papaver somniferum]